MSDPGVQDGDRPRTLVLGVIGADVHIVGIKVLDFALRQAGFHVVNLGIMASQDDFVKAAIETAADAILVSSVYGHGELDCRGFRDKCVEAGIGAIPLLVGGNLVIGKQPWPEVEGRFLAMGFDRVYPPGTSAETAIADLRTLLGSTTEVSHARPR